MVVFAADATPWYQDFGFWASFLTVVAGLASAAWFLARYRYRQLLQHRIAERDRALREMNAELEQLKAARGPERDEVRRRFARARQVIQQLKAKADDLAADAERLDDNMRIAEQVQGRTWYVKPADDAPRFVPLSERRTPIIAVLNLKGGIGKTTLTANLAAAWARGGRRVLLVDLDLQASLSSLFISGEDIAKLAENRRLVQHYFEHAAVGDGPKFVDFIHHCSEHRVELVGSADTLAYAELGLTFRWLRRPNDGDVRLLLRDALHRHARDYDLVLIDCPPLMNVSCVNALAAADFVLIPVLPTKLAADRVRPMLAWLRALRKNLNPDLHLLGVVANRIQQATGMSGAELDLWNALRDQCKDAWGHEVPMGKTFIPQNVAIRDAENQRRPLKSTDATFAYFEKLAKELAARLPAPAAPAAAGVRG